MVRASVYTFAELTVNQTAKISGRAKKEQEQGTKVTVIKSRVTKYREQIYK